MYTEPGDHAPGEVGTISRGLSTPATSTARWLRLRSASIRKSFGAKLVSHGRYVAFRMVDVALARMLFAEILRPTAELRPPPDPASV